LFLFQICGQTDVQPNKIRQHLKKKLAVSKLRNIDIDRGNVVQHVVWQIKTSYVCATDGSVIVLRG